MGELQQLAAADFQSEVIEATLPVILDFWGPRCAPCIELEPFVAQLSRDFDGRIKISKVVAPENRKLCIELKVMGLPTYLAFKGGREVARLAGQVSREAIRGMVDDLVSGIQSE